ncbi:MAG: phosphotransferase family protein [Pyrinomonadaceae bacterium]
MKTAVWAQSKSDRPGFMIETTAARKGEELNSERLRSFLGSRLGFKTDEIEILQFPAGSSNLTYLVKVGEDEYVLRRPPFGNTVKTAHDMRREFEVLSKLSAVYAPAPKPLLFCDDESVIGSEFYLMERRNGLIIRGSIERVSSPHVSGGSADASATLDNSSTLRTNVCRSFIQNLADLHALDYNAAGLADLGKPVGYNHRQIEGWTKRYIAAKTHDLPELEKTIAWLNDNIPAESGAALIHNDYKFDNIMLDPSDLTRITAVLDWEMVTIGDPLMDLGTTLGYWMSRDAGEEMLNMPFNPRVLMENVSRGDLVQMYAVASGRDVSNILFYYVFGTFKIAVIAQQIYSRYVRGFTQDKRFARFDEFVSALGRIATYSIGKKSI